MTAKNHNHSKTEQSLKQKDIWEAIQNLLFLRSVKINKELARNNLTPSIENEMERNSEY